MTRAVLSLIVIVSCAHALVHAYELSLPSVEMQVAADYYPDDVESGKRFTGMLSTTWRLPWGLGAMLAGWLVDRYGSRRMLIIYLFGCSVVCLIVGLELSQPLLFLAMFSMGAMASIYHPAGLALISHSTTPQTRTRALGIHGIFGSAGIATAPMLFGLLQTAQLGWHAFYAILAVPGLVLAVWLLFMMKDTHQKVEIAKAKNAQVKGNWRSFYVLVVLALLQGIVYSGVLSFLTRYISGSQLSVSWLKDLSKVSMITSVILLLGCIGQYLAGSLAKPEKLEAQLTGITFANAPLLCWMAVAEGQWRIVSAGLFAIVHFMHQPIYNSLIAKYTPSKRRSLCYGFSFAMGLGLGSFGASFAGQFQSDLLVFLSLAGCSTAATFAGALLWQWNRSTAEDGEPGTK